MAYENRSQAGKALAKEVKKYADEDLLILGIPRGGVIVGRALRDEIGGELGIIITKKIGFPGNPEYGIGAVAEDGTIVLSDAGKKSRQATDSYLAEESGRQKSEIARRMNNYRYVLPEDLSSKTVVVTDDGIATGMTVLAALKYLRKKRPKKLVLAVPVAPADTIQKLKSEADEVICLLSPLLFYAVGQFYLDFEQVSDEEVIRALHGDNEYT